MLERAIFFDRDNTIIDNDGYLGDAKQVKLLPNAAAALAALRGLGYRLIVVSNQSGVARGLFSEADVKAVNLEMCRQLKDEAGVHIDASYYCPYHPEATVGAYRQDHDWRKPKPGMLLQAARDFDLDLSRCWMIGDQPRDIAAGAAAGCRTILLRDPDHQLPDAEPAGLPVSSDYIIKSLGDAARIIAREGATKPPQPVPAAKPAEPAPAPPPPPPSEPAPATVPAVPVTVPTATTHLARLEKTIDDLVLQLRHQSRQAEMPRDFPKTRFAAIIVQVFAVLALIVGFYHLMTASASLKGSDWHVAMSTLLRGAIWTLSAIFLQVLALTLLHLSKDH
ncbi:MAG: HAD family hydrolase [Phycisphaerales bacterium]|nr:HAD family hydrolase [Phycisphaerales bacterium]